MEQLFNERIETEKQLGADKVAQMAKKLTQLKSLARKFSLQATPRQLIGHEGLLSDL